MHSVNKLLCIVLKYCGNKWLSMCILKHVSESDVRHPCLVSGQCFFQVHALYIHIIVQCQDTITTVIGVRRRTSYGSAWYVILEVSQCDLTHTIFCSLRVLSIVLNYFAHCEYWVLFWTILLITSIEYCFELFCSLRVLSIVLNYFAQYESLHCD